MNCLINFNKNLKNKNILKIKIKKLINKKNQILDNLMLR